MDPCMAVKCLLQVSAMWIDAKSDFIDKVLKLQTWIKMITGVPNAESFGSHPFVFWKQASYIYIIINLALKNSSVHT